MSKNNLKPIELVKINNGLDYFSNINDDNDDNDDNISRNSNLSNQILISSISSSIKDKLSQNDKNESIINYINNTLTSWEPINDNLETHLPEIQLPEIQLPEIQLPTTHLPEIQLPEIQLPEIQLPEIHLPEIQLPTTHLPETQLLEIQLPEIQLPGLQQEINQKSNPISIIKDIKNIEIPIPNVTFTSEDLNEIKSFTTNLSNKNKNFENLSSINSGSEISYTTIAKSQLPLEITKISKHIRGVKKTNKNKNKNENELDEVDYLYNKIQDYIRYMNIDRCNYILVIVKAIEIIENYHNETEFDKKSTVIKALNRIVLIDLNLSEFDQLLFLSSINNIIEIIILCSKNNKNCYKNNNEVKHNDDDFILASTGQIIHSLIDKITTIVIKKQYNADKLFVNICTITDILMILVNKYNYITSIEKKIIVIQSFTKFITEKLEYIIDLNKEKKQNLLYALNSVPILIDLFIALKNGKYKINRKTINMELKDSHFKNLFCLSKKHDCN